MSKNALPFRANKLPSGMLAAMTISGAQHIPEAFLQSNTNRVSQ